MYQRDYTENISLSNFTLKYISYQISRIAIDVILMFSFYS